MVVASIGYITGTLSDAVAEAMKEHGIPCSIAGTVVHWVSVPRERVAEARDILLSDPRFQGQMIVFYDENTGDTIFPPEQVPHWSFDDRWREDLVLLARVPGDEVKDDVLTWNMIHEVLFKWDIPSEERTAGDLCEIWVPRQMADAARGVLRSDPELRGRTIEIAAAGRRDEQGSTTSPGGGAGSGPQR